MRRTSASLAALSLLAVGAPAALLASPAAAQEADPSVTGRWGAPFEDPDEPRCEQEGEDPENCKPAAGSIGMLPNGKVVYWDALDSVQEPQLNAVAEFGHLAENDMARVLDLRGGEGSYTWTDSEPDTSVPAEGNDGSEFLPGPLQNNDEKDNDGDLFCSDQLFLADGRILNVGGTSYYQEPGIPGMPTYGVVELEGLKNSRLYDPESNTWEASGQMTYGRWYPSVVTLPDSTVLALSGVTKLIKPVYPDRPADSGRNVTQSEVYDPDTGEWTPDGGSKSLPLYPRVHLLPNGHVYYDAGGQTFNPAGQAYDEALWNTAASYDPETQTWRDLGLPQFGDALVGFRGSAFSQMLPLRPDEDGEYRTAQFLSAGGVYGVSPGTYVGTDTSTLNTVTIGEDGTETFASEATSALNNARWYSTGVSLPTGEVIAFSGADRDEVVAPGSGTPETTPEIFDPETGEWTELADAAQGRTYHNSATLLQDGTVLVGGHAPITTGYAVATDAFQETLGFSDPDRDPSFEIFEPPNLFYGPRPVIASVDPQVERGGTMKINVTDADALSSVTLVRNTAMTHLVDSDQRTVELEIVERRGGSVTVAVPDGAAVLPDGPYLLFANQEHEQGETPSVGRQVFVGEVPAELRDDIATNNNATVAEELRARDQAIDAAQTDAAQTDAAQTDAAAQQAGSATGSGDEAGAGATLTEVLPSAVSASTALGTTDRVARRTALPFSGLDPAPVLLASLLVGSGLLLHRRVLARA